MNKKLLIAAFLLTITLAYPRSEEVFEGRVFPANNRDYGELLTKRLKEAKKSVYMIMFLASYYPEYRDTSPTNLFMDELIKAKKRGVRVEIILEQSGDSRDSHSSNENLKAAMHLSAGGITVYFDPPEKTTHAKLLVIDEKIVVIGSANWSYSAMAKNNEASVIIESPELADFYIKYFEETRKTCPSSLRPAGK
ncbi:MAG: phospholipase [Candidatus Omnitrophica bacterium]|nr:phospholipase [Candidatus Omnitrophota bacterium]